VKVIAMLSHLLLALVLGAIVGCRERELARLAREAADRQAEQNRIVGKLVDENLKSRQDLLELQQGFQRERKWLNSQQASLESERRSIAGERRTESMLVAATRGLGLVLLALAAIGFAMLVIFGLRNEPHSAADVYDLVLRDVLPTASTLLMKAVCQQEQLKVERKEHESDESRGDDRNEGP
jgi:hypothetical protein